MLACATPQELSDFLGGLTPETLAALPYLWEVWAFPHQLAPEGDWRSWVVLGGRGAGKTRAGAEWVRAQVEGAKPLDPGRARSVALVGETYDQAREVMVMGPSGILACSPPDRKPRWLASRRKLVWPNGAEAQVFSANDPEALRGPQFDAAWVDELAKWPNAQETWDMLQFALRLGEHPQQVVTTTPRPVDVLKMVLALSSTVVTRGATEANRAYLAKSFLTEIRERYAHSRLGRQELDGEMFEDIEGALWTRELLGRQGVTERPELDRIVVAVDPPVTGHAGSDACGIIVAGISLGDARAEWRGYVLADRSVQGVSPQTWARRVVEVAQEWEADRVVAEVNQGGDLVETLLRQVDPLLSVEQVRATRSKVVRAEPVAALYEQGRVFHMAGLGKLEDQLCQMTPQGFEGTGSPDRVDALVWAIHALMLKPRGVPTLRVL